MDGYAGPQNREPFLKFQVGANEYLSMKIAILCNPTEEGRKSIAMGDAIITLLQQKGIDYAGFTTYWPEVWDDFTDIWIVGGDGTLNRFINLHPQIRLPLSLFPAGSGNDFHSMLYGALKLEEQVNRVLAVSPRPVDAGICNGQLFLNGIGIGFDGAIVKDLIGKKKIAGKASYHISILKNIVGYKERACEVTVDEETWSGAAFLISIANGKRYGGGFQVTPRALADDSLLDLNFVGNIHPLRRIQLLPVIERGQHLSLPMVKYRQGRRFVVQCNSELPAHADGEYLQAARFEVDCLPGRFLFRW